MRNPSACLAVLLIALGAACSADRATTTDTAPDTSDAFPPGPGPVPQRAGVLYETELWTRPADSLGGTATCRVRAIPGCETLTVPGMLDAAIAGDRLVVLMARDERNARGTWDLLVSDDRGKTVRRFSLDRFAGGNSAGRLHLVNRRIFLLAELADGTDNRAHVFEIDPASGAVIVRGAGVMSTTYGRATADGVLTTVAYTRTAEPPVISVTRFDPATNAIQQNDVGCHDPACEFVSEAFISSDGESFNRLTHPTGSAFANQGCLVKVSVSNRTVGVECSAAFAVDVRPLTSAGGTGYDFAEVGETGGSSWTLLPVARNWIPTGRALPIASDRADSLGDGFFTYSPSARGTPGDSILVRVLPGGSLQKTAVQHEGCLDLASYYNDGRDCAHAVEVLPLPGDEVLFITVRDEFHDDVRSRLLFEVGHSSAPFEAFQP